MLRKSLHILTLLFVLGGGALSAQKNKVQAAWRNLSDYEETLKEGKPDPSYLQKAREAIDVALQNPEPKLATRAQSYKLRISYAQYQQLLAQENKKLEPTVQDKNERALQAYGNTDLKYFNEASEALNQIRESDPQYLAKVQRGLSDGGSALDEDEQKFALAVQNMKIEAGSIASGKYKVKNYEEAADYFYKTAFMNSVLAGVIDTANFYNACVAATKSKNPEKILEYNKKMIDAKIATPFNFQSLYDAHLSKGDTASAMEMLKKGRTMFPEDAGLLSQETNMFLAMDKQQEALGNLEATIQRDSTNGLYHYIVGNIYDNMANPKEKGTNKELPKPADFDALFSKAEAAYRNAVRLKHTSQDSYYNSLYNLGALYNNHGQFIASQKVEKGPDQIKIQKANEEKAQVYYKKAIPYLEQALAIKSNDKVTMAALRKLYLVTNDAAKAKEMNERMKTVQ